MFCLLKINYLNKENKIKGHELEVKSQECEQLEMDVLEAQSMLQQSTSRIHELEEIQAQQQEQVNNIVTLGPVFSSIFWRAYTVTLVSSLMLPVVKSFLTSNNFKTMIYIFNFNLALVLTSTFSVYVFILRFAAFTIRNCCNIRLKMVQSTFL